MTGDQRFASKRPDVLDLSDRSAHRRRDDRRPGRAGVARRDERHRRATSTSSSSTSSPTTRRTGRATRADSSSPAISSSCAASRSAAATAAIPRSPSRSCPISPTRCASRCPTSTTRSRRGIGSWCRSRARGSRSTIAIRRPSCRTSSRRSRTISRRRRCACIHTAALSSRLDVHRSFRMGRSCRETWFARLGNCNPMMRQLAAPALHHFEETFTGLARSPTMAAPTAVPPDSATDRGVYDSLEAIRSLLIPGEELEACAIQRRLFAMMHRRAMVGGDERPVDHRAARDVRRLRSRGLPVAGSARHLAQGRRLRRDPERCRCIAARPRDAGRRAAAARHRRPAQDGGAGGLSRLSGARAGVA